ncbi:hypothetical protein I551_0933 [Mycobacterium ulcerans str. Harvey]|uniref:Mycothiol-dependent maleylpyruvate isomerase metal-binding domain-containing protein n=1 Tax=Mycobacterium ulcerans str. Harvey TaxID=1299332 RepID=A0ABP3AN64_MYCUL|nr:hypothetical protein I551_0933 [Mycobacterium ulcerans str. Harvey]
MPSCPGWNLGQLFRHVGRGDRWAAQIVRDRLNSFLDPRNVAGGKPPAAVDDAIAWLQDGAQLMVDAVEQAGAETPVWTFLGPRPAHWWVRRRLHEVVVHRADAAIALGQQFVLEPEIAADGISEFLERIAVQAGTTAPRCRSRTATPCICTPPIPVSVTSGNGPPPSRTATSPGRLSTAKAPWPCAAAPRSFCWR